LQTRLYPTEKVTPEKSKISTMTSEQLQWKRKYEFTEKLLEHNIPHHDWDLSEFDFDPSAFRTAQEVGGRCVIMTALNICEKEPERGQYVLNWLKAQRLSEYLLEDELNFLKGESGFGDLPIYSWGFVVADEMQQALCDFEGATEQRSHEGAREFSASIRVLIEFGLPVQSKLDLLVLRDPEEIFSSYLICKAHTMNDLENGDLSFDYDSADLFRLYSWITGIESELLKKIPFFY
jgi:hypothetical protein